jgi:adenylate cyclase
MTDIFEVQDEIAAAVISKIAGSTSLQPNRRLPTENIEAYALYVEARGLLGKYSFANIRAAEQRLLRAVELDPHFAQAYEQLAFAYWEQDGVTLTSSEAHPLQSNAAAEALRLDPELAFARFMLSDVSASTQLSEILEDLTGLAQTGQHQSFAFGTLTWYLIYMGYFREALVFAERYLQHDPYSAGSHRHVAYALLANGRQREAIEALEIAARLEGGLNSLYLAQLQYGLRRDDESIAAFAAAWRENGVDVESLPEMLAGVRGSEDLPGRHQRQGRHPGWSGVMG